MATRLRSAPRVARCKLPDRIEIVPKPARNAMNKVPKRELPGLFRR